MGCDIGAISVGNHITICITVNGPITPEEGQDFSMAVNAAIKAIRDVHADAAVTVDQQPSPRVEIACEGLSRTQAEAYALRVRELLAGEKVTIRVRQTR